MRYQHFHLFEPYQARAGGAILATPWKSIKGECGTQCAKGYFATFKSHDPMPKLRPIFKKFDKWSDWGHSNKQVGS